MSQRVNIQYSIEIDNLEAEIVRLAEAASVSLTAAANDFCLRDYDLSVTSMQMIDDLRQKLAHIDQSLNDINKITAGYLSYQASLIAPTNEPSQQNETPIEQLPDIDTSSSEPTIDQVIENYKNNNSAS